MEPFLVPCLSVDSILFYCRRSHFPEEEVGKEKRVSPHLWEQSFCRHLGFFLSFFPSPGVQQRQEQTLRLTNLVWLPALASCPADLKLRQELWPFDKKEKAPPSSSLPFSFSFLAWQQFGSR